MKAEPKESDKHRLPKSHHLHVAQQGQMIEVVRFLERNRAPQNIRFEAHIRVGEQQPLARGSVVGFLQSMRLAQPAFRKPVDVHHAEPWIGGRKRIENFSRSILRAVVNGDHFEVWIVNFHEGSKRRGQLFLFVSGAEKHGNSRALRIPSGREVSDPGKAYGSVGNPETVGEPKYRDNPKQRDSNEMHGDWSRRYPQVILARYGKDPGHPWGRARRARAGAPLARIGLEDRRGRQPQRACRPARRAIYRRWDTARSFDPSRFWVARHSDCHA